MRDRGPVVGCGGGWGWGQMQSAGCFQNIVATLEVCRAAARAPGAGASKAPL